MIRYEGIPSVAALRQLSEPKVSAFGAIPQHLYEHNVEAGKRVPAKMLPTHVGIVPPEEFAIF